MGSVPHPKRVNGVWEKGDVTSSQIILMHYVTDIAILFVIGSDTKNLILTPH